MTIIAVALFRASTLLPSQVSRPSLDHPCLPPYRLIRLDINGRFDHIQHNTMGVVEVNKSRHPHSDK
ncbi:hypothetical protein RRG08_040387 [Elysia crispata]|uniref:Uncharacterized protein n=1 Tax=Elysia crispata TaxID=231223 RepID=A0AAE1A1J5_9GAST|nr:hypothetical protein RRG08_040387 [Elysia crispata]